MWAFATLTTALEAGLLEPLTEPQELGHTSAQPGLDPSLVGGMLDVLVALRFAHRDGQLFVAAPALRLLLAPETKEILLAQLRSVDLQSRQLIDGARQGGLGLGWRHTDPMLLEAQGHSGQGAIPAMIQSIRQNPELAARLGQPSARFLDVGVGVGVIAIELCRAFPALRVLGLEPAAATLAQARANVAAAKLADRIELRQQGRPAGQRDVRPGLRRPGILSLMGSMRSGWPGYGGRYGPAAGSTCRRSAPPLMIWRPPCLGCATFSGGGVRLPEEVAETARAVGFTEVQVTPHPGQGPRRQSL